MSRISSVRTGLFTILLFSFSCQKEGPVGPVGPVGPQGEAGPNAITKTYVLTYDGSLSFSDYIGFIGDYESNDVIISYIYWNDYGGDPYYIQLPYTDAASGGSFYTEVNNVSGLIFQNAENASGNAFFTSSANIGYKSVLIKGSALGGLPNDFDFSNYEEVRDYFELDE